MRLRSGSGKIPRGTEIEKICLEQAGEQIVTPVNYNSPGQVVIAGHADAVARAAEALKEAGAKRVLPLPVSVPSHCALMQPAASQLADALKSIKLNQMHSDGVSLIQRTTK